MLLLSPAGKKKKYVKFRMRSGIRRENEDDGCLGMRNGEEQWKH